MIDGGPAFPLLNIFQPWNTDTHEYDGIETEVDSPGMSLRDYFAAHAAIGAADAVGDLLDSGDLDMSNVIKRAEGVAKRYAAAAYLVADAMLKARKADTQ